MEYKIPVKEENLCLAVIKALNFSLRLTDKEQEVLAYLIKNNIKIIDYDSRRKLSLDFNKDYFYITNLLKRLYDKKVLIKTKYGKTVHPNLINSLTSKEITIRFDVQNKETNISRE